MKTPIKSDVPLIVGVFVLIHSHLISTTSLYISYPLVEVVINIIFDNYNTLFMYNLGEMFV